MAATTTGVLLASAIIAGAGTAGYQGYQASQAKSQAIDEKGKLESEAFAAQKAAEAKKKQEKDIMDAKILQQEQDRAANAQRLADQRKKQSMAGYGGQRKGGTLLTGPLGLGATSASPTKTLLGA